MKEHPTKGLRLSHYMVAWGPPAGEKTLTYKTEKAALREAKRFDKDCKRYGEKDAHRVFAVYVKELAR